MAARGERGALVIDQDFLTRLSSNPFFPYVLEKIETDQRRRGPVGTNIATTASPELPVRVEALLSTMLPKEQGMKPFAGPTPAGAEHPWAGPIPRHARRPKYHILL